jgi:hypothetical protein
MPRNIAFLVRLVISAFVLLCTIEALYWPILMKPGTQLGWWQVHWLAQIGFYVGFIPCGIALFSGSPVVALLSSAAFALFVFWLLRALFRRFERGPSNTHGHAMQNRLTRRSS